MAAFIDIFIKSLMDLGFVQVLTLVMMITIVYAVLSRSKLFGDPDDSTAAKAKRANAINVIIALVLGFMVFISPIGREVDLWFTKFFVHILIILVVALGIFLLVGMAGHKFDENNPLIRQKTALIVGTAIVALIFFNAGGLELFGLQGTDDGVIGTNPIPSLKITPEVWAQIIGAIVVLGIFIGSLAMVFMSGKGDHKK